MDVGHGVTGTCVLAVNCGSSSLRVAAYEGDECAARITVERVGGTARVITSDHGVRRTEAVDATDHARALAIALERLPASLRAPFAIGHRVVHGGARLRQSTCIDTRVLEAIESHVALVPLHNASTLRAIRAASTFYGPRVPQVAVFDTEFHADLPRHARYHAIPSELSEKHELVRVGFHGLAHRSMTETYARLHDGRANTALVTLQLGHGCSVAAVRGGRSIDVTMGTSPLEGLMMGTRSGDLDPALVARLAALEQVDADTVESWLNLRSGLLGVSGRSSDMRELLAAERAGDARSALAVEMFVHRARKAIGAMLAVLGGADALVFGGGIGENSAEIRARICAGFEWCGLELEPERNARDTGGARQISRASSRLGAWVAPVDEEALIARETLRVVTS